MLTKIGKVLVVLVTVLCVAFAGFAMIVTAGGPNWQARADALEEYRFEQTEGDSPQWTAVFRLRGEGAGETVGSPSPVLAQKIADALDHKLRRQQDELQQLALQIDGDPQRGIPSLAARAQEAQQLIQTDIQALQQYETQLRTQIAAVNQAIDQASKQFVQKSQEATDKASLAAERREDLYRLRNQLAELEADLFRTLEQQSKIRDLLNRMYGTIARLKGRADQLKARGGTGGDYEPAATGAGE
ncbi:MAG: hypothetical protein KY476_08615 [Planctomycetes bacterium]|nr:hypothetical protein [Planctomycetota bacterium]